MARRPLRRRTSCTGSNKPLAAGTPIRRPLSGADVVTCAVNAPISAAISWVAPVPAPLAPSADVQSLLPTPEPVPRDPLVHTQVCPTIVRLTGIHTATQGG